jgi:hypothetical protein
VHFTVGNRKFNYFEVGSNEPQIIWGLCISLEPIAGIFVDTRKLISKLVDTVSI